MVDTEIVFLEGSLHQGDPSTIKVGFTTTILGNLSFRSGPQNMVQENQAKLRRLLGGASILILNSRHSLTINTSSKSGFEPPRARQVALGDNSLGSFVNQPVFTPPDTDFVRQSRDGFDGLFLVGHHPGLYILSPTADCVTLLFHHPQTNSIGAVHVGLWAALHGFGGAAVRAWKEFSIPPAELKIWLSPCIRSCYQVSQSSVWKMIPPQIQEQYPLSNGRINLDQIIIQQLIANGVNPDQVNDCGICTSCAPNLFSNFRGGANGDRSLVGRFGSFIGYTN
ncbi:MAG: polyphenol oxidase family protein [Candidatus Komeilibacteria bacterium]|nr:polyphenol oxidase family protein [Candidatus Komeilibacteria bacterium]